MSDKKFDLEDRLIEFAAMVVLFCKNLPNEYDRPVLWKPIVTVCR